MAKFDLLTRIAPYMDRHLILPLLEFITARKVFDEKEMLEAKVEILKATKMIDYTIETMLLVYPEDTISQEEMKEMKERRSKIIEELFQMENTESVQTVNRLMHSDEIMKEMETFRDSKALVNFLSQKSDGKFGLEMMDDIVKYAKFNYECGVYTRTSSYLYLYTIVMPPTDKNYLKVCWGKLAAEILAQDWETALEDITKLREYIDSNLIGNQLEILHQRTWFIHWSLYIFFNHVRGRDLIIDTFLYRAHYLNVIQTTCPHILRYLATAVIVNQSRRSALKDLVKVIQQESYSYRDPITEFVEHLYVNFDFDGARQKLQECQDVISSDFFLTSLLPEFVENARLMIFETFCRIHQCISIHMVAEKLNMKEDAAECWIVNLIRKSRLGAKIDSKLGYVVMGGQPTSPYQQLVEKIEALTVRSEALENLIEKKQRARNPDSSGMVWN